MNQENFSVELKNLIDFMTNTLVRDYPTYRIGQYHLLYSLLENQKTLFTKIVSEIVTDFTLEKLLNNTQLQLEKVSLAIINPKKKIVFEKEVEEIFDLSDKERVLVEEKEITTYHLLISILKSNYNISQLLKKAGVSCENVKSKKEIIDEEEIIIPTRFPKQGQGLSVLPNGVLIPTTKGNNNAKGLRTQSIKQFTTNLNLECEHGVFENKILGRDSEVEQLIKTILKKEKNNVILTGDSGCGITSIVNHFVSKIVQGTVPYQLVNRMVLQINIQSMLVGMVYKGIFEQRTSDLIKEIKSNTNKYILFIDDINTVIQSDANNEVINFITTILQDDRLRVIATCSNQSYKSTVGKFAHLDKRFNRINIEKLSVDDTFTALLENKIVYECHHNVYFTPKIVAQCVFLCNRYITSKVLPSSAIEILDILGANTQINKQDKRLEDLVAQKQQLFIQMYEHRVQERFKEMDAIDAKYNKLHQEINEIQKEPGVIINITEEDLLKVISEVSKVPITNISVNEMNTIKELPNELKKEIINQDDAVNSICKSIQKRKINIRNTKKPNVFLFVGPSGVGKTFLSELIAKHVFGSEKNIIKLNGSEYSEDHSVSKILGAPAGYIGYNNNASLSEIKTKPFSILLLDEFEKMSDKVINVFLQIFDKGELRESDGTILDFSNSIIILTSNLGSRNAESYNKVGFNTQTNIDRDKQDIIDKEIKKKLSPEIRNRIDEIIHFNHLQETDLKNIINLQLQN